MGTSRWQTGLFGGLAMAITAPLVAGWMTAPALATSQAPPGNNGTIKVDGMPVDGQNAKHKVFWIQGCGQSSATGATSANSAGAANGAGAGAQAARRAELARRAQLSTRTAAVQAGTTSAAAPAGAAVLGATASR